MRIAAQAGQSLGWLGALLAASAAAQSLIPANEARQLGAALLRQPVEHELRCDLTPIRPTLDLSFRYHSGYSVAVPMSQFEGANHSWLALMRVTPAEGGSPALFAARANLPVVPEKTKVNWTTTGGYLVGPGRYHVEWALFDDQNRICRKQWDIDASPKRGERNVKLAISPGTVAELSGWGLPREARATDDSVSLRLTILLHAAPIMPRRTRLRASDRILLLSSLGTVLDRVPAVSVRLVVFSLDQQRELLRQDHFHLRNLDQVGQALSQLELSTVDYRVLQNRKGHIDLLTDLMKSEAESQEPSDAVLFMGPAPRFIDKVPVTAVEKPLSAQHYFNFQFLGLRSPNEPFQDSIMRAVARMKGRTMTIRTAGDFASAIAQMERIAAPVARGLSKAR